jgi:branched-chain amino acid transport system substrate-binding protein
MTFKRTIAKGLSAAGLILASGLALAAGQYGPGASDTEIKIGNTMPYSGPASAYGIIGKTEAAYFAMINEQGGINGRKINFISRDDGYSPPKTVEQVRQLVEQDQVLFMFSTLGTPTNVAIHGYMNDNKVPQLFVATGADQWNDPKRFPWTIGLIPSYGTEAHIYARYILKNLPDAKIAVLYQNDDFGKDYLNGLRAGLGDKASKMIVATQSYETTDPTVDSQVVALQSERRRRPGDARHTQIRRPSDPQGLRYRLEADPFSHLGGQFGRNGDEDRGDGEGRRHYLGGLRQGSHRSAVAGHAGIQGMAGFYEEV